MTQSLEALQSGIIGLIAPTLKAQKVYEISRSFRIGVTTEATNIDNKECSGNNIWRNNCRRVEDRANIEYTDLDMLLLESYSILHLNLMSGWD